MTLRTRDTTALAAGSLLTGLIAYVFFATTTRALGPVAASPVTVLWTYWSLSAAAFTFPVQHWIARTATAYDEGVVRRAVPRIAAVVAATSALVGLLSWFAGDILFRRDQAVFSLLMVGVTAGSGLMGVARGTLTARRRFGSVAVMLVAENAVRWLAALVLVVADVEEPVAFGVCLVAGHLVAFGWPSSLRLMPGRLRTTAGSPLGFLSGAASGQLLGQVVLTGGPVVLALRGGSAAQVTALFAALALFRAPYMLALGVVAQLTGRLTTLVVGGQRAELRRVQVAIVTSAVASAALAALVGGTVGPVLVRWVFGDDVTLDAATTILVAIASAVALANLVTTVLVLALNRAGAVVRAWILGTGAAAAVLVISDTNALDQTCWAFLAAQVVALLVLLAEASRGRSGVIVAPPDESSSLPPGV
ncbi:MAG: hypothetical protein ACR2FP_02020 [Nocardioidaceae bacterium]